MKKGGFVYILTNRHKTVLYIGVTSNLKRRVWEHANHEVKNSFTDKYNIEYLLYYEWFENITDAIEREKKLKKWNRQKKEELIASKNPDWDFLNEEIYREVYRLLY
ncbi:MAG: GIY-YIG nuclease family protein [Sphingobacteriales bacterium]|jgi:putative endonuclease|nr:GIY-YIG nuclease family protein [Sphingobacteriales bacterium]